MSSKRPRSDPKDDGMSIEDRSKSSQASKRPRTDMGMEGFRPCGHKTKKDIFGEIKQIIMQKQGRSPVGDIIAALQNQHDCPFCKFLVETFQILEPNYTYRIYGRENGEPPKHPHSTIYLASDQNAWFSRAGISSKEGLESCPYAWLQIGKEADQPLVCISFRPESASSTRLTRIYPKARFDVEAFNGSIRPGEIQKWLEICNGDNHNECKLKDRKSFKVSKDFRLFDVEDRCIRPYQHCLKPGQALEALEYLTLSYKWGEQKWQGRKGKKDEGYFPMNTKIAEGDLPQTFENAISITRELDKRYLWIDLLCIKQKNKVELADQLSFMDSVYSLSWLTIVSVDGPNWDHGLRAVSKSIFQSRQPIWRTPRGELMATYIHPQSQYDGNSPWDQRAFTFQERLLSRRLLLFADTYYALLCKKELFHDLLDVDNVDLKGERPTFNLDESTFRGDGSGLNLDETSWNFSTYARLVSAYTRRQITHDSDIEKACTGALKRITQQTQVQFHHGIPERDLLQALLWVPHHEHIHSRRDGFPSWSWLGWKGTTVYPEWMQQQQQQKKHEAVTMQSPENCFSDQMAGLRVNGENCDPDKCQDRNTTKVAPIMTAGKVHMGKTAVRLFKVRDICPSSTEPESAEPESAEPESAEPESAEPESAEPESVEPESVEPESVEPESVEPESAESESAESESPEAATSQWAVLGSNGQLLYNKFGGDRTQRSIIAFHLDQEQSDVVRRLNCQLYLIFIMSWVDNPSPTTSGKRERVSKRSTHTMVSALVTFVDEDGFYQRLASVTMSKDEWNPGLPSEGDVTMSEDELKMRLPWEEDVNLA